MSRTFLDTSDDLDESGAGAGAAMVDASRAALRRSKLAVAAPDHVHELLEHLHELSTAQESAITLPSRAIMESPEGRAALDFVMRDKFVALHQDKCHFVYSLLRAAGATRVVEAGTSFGVSTIYLALAVGQNIAAGHPPGTVIATENEPAKARQAHEYWAECGPDVASHIELREGDLLETLKSGLPDQVDFLLLDIWAPLALPTLKLVMPRLKRGGIVCVDNVVAREEAYADLLMVLQDPAGPFKSTTLPYTDGFEMCVYLP